MNNIYKKTLLAVLIILIFAPLTSFSEEGVEAVNEIKKFTKRECRQAVRWINKDLSLLMGSGILKKIIVKKDVYNLYAGEAWYELEFEQRGDILKNLSRSREVMGHSPLLKIFDFDSGKTVAAVSKEQIKIQFQDEGFFQYLPHGEKPEQTFY